MQIDNVLEGTLGASALNYVASLAILRLAGVGRRSMQTVDTKYPTH